MDHGTTSTTDIRLAELMAALSLATDLDMGQPLEWALCSCVPAVRLGDTLGFSAEELREIYYQALLHYIVCNSETHMLAALAGDEIALRTDFATIDSGSLPQMLGMMTRHIRQANVGASRLELAQVIVRNLLLSAHDTPGFFSGHCEAAQHTAVKLRAPEPRPKAVATATVCFNGLFGRPSLARRSDQKSSPLARPGSARSRGAENDGRQLRCGRMKRANWCWRSRPSLQRGTFWSGMVSLAFGIDESEFGAEALLLAPPSCGTWRIAKVIRLSQPRG